MKPWVPPVILLSLAAVGFGIAKVMTDKKNVVTVGGVDHRAEVYQGDGGFFAVVFVDGVASGTPLGPFTEDEAYEAAANYLASLGHLAFYSLREEDTGWFFDGWSQGMKTDSDGPFADKEAAKVAGARWVNVQLKLPPGGAAVGEGYAPPPKPTPDPPKPTPAPWRGQRSWGRAAGGK